MYIYGLRTNSRLLALNTQVKWLTSYVGQRGEGASSCPLQPATPPTGLGPSFSHMDGKLAKLLPGVDGLLCRPFLPIDVESRRGFKKKKKGASSSCKSCQASREPASLPACPSLDPNNRPKIPHRPTLRIPHTATKNSIRRHAQIIPPPLVANITPAVGVLHLYPARICPRFPEKLRIRSAGIRCRCDRCAVPRLLYMGETFLC